jgi:4-hydroxybenzoate polyprenyltransferase
MGLCRFLNVMLGVTVAGNFAWPVSQHLATVVGLYIAGVTTFARTETQLSRKSHLAVAASIILVALAAALALPVHHPVDTASPLFVYLLVALGFFVGFPIVRAIGEPTPSRVQAAVKRCLVGLILLDAVLATALAGTVGLAVLVLLAPSLWLNRQKWLYAT